MLGAPLTSDLLHHFSANFKTHRLHGTAFTYKSIAILHDQEYRGLDFSKPVIECLKTDAMLKCTVGQYPGG